MLSAVSVKASVAYERVYHRFHVQSSWSVDLFLLFSSFLFLSVSVLSAVLASKRVHSVVDQWFKRAEVVT